MAFSLCCVFERDGFPTLKYTYKYAIICRCHRLRNRYLTTERRQERAASGRANSDGVDIYEDNRGSLLFQRSSTHSVLMCTPPPVSEPFYVGRQDDRRWTGLSESLRGKAPEPHARELKSRRASRTRRRARRQPLRRRTRPAYAQSTVLCIHNVLVQYGTRNFCCSVRWLVYGCDQCLCWNHVNQFHYAYCTIHCKIHVQKS